VQVLNDVSARHISTRFPYFLSHCFVLLTYFLKDVLEIRSLVF
jgi:hypothetical protein